MAARDLFLPTRALGQTIEAFERRLTQLLRRATWPSVVQSDDLYYGGATFTTVQNWDAVTYPEAGTVEATSIMLDPGRWVLFASLNASFEWTAGGGGELGMVLDWSDGVQSVHLVQSRLSYQPSYDIERTFMLSVEVTSSLPSTASISMFTGAEPGYSTAADDLYRVFLCAFPG